MNFYESREFRDIGGNGIICRLEVPGKCHQGRGENAIRVTDGHPHPNLADIDPKAHAPREVAQSVPSRSSIDLGQITAAPIQPQ
ncbi:hypothetical protein GCM10027290_12800 [Micromonospora sonneratiae]